MSTMIETVARAICRSGSLCCEHAPQMSCYATSHLESARAAIEAMREPSDRMVAEGESAASFGIGRPNDEEAIPRVWKWMLDAALSGDA